MDIYKVGGGSEEDCHNLIHFHHQVPTCCSCHIMGYSYVYPPLKKGGEQSPATHGSSGSGSSQLNLPPQRPLPNSQDSFQIPQLPSNPSRPAPQLTPDSFPRPQPDLDNFIPDFNPQEELQAFMETIGDDFKDFNFGKSARPVRNNQVSHIALPNIFFQISVSQRPGSFRVPGSSNSRPAVGGFQPISGDLRPPPPRNRRRGQHFTSGSIRRGDGFGPAGKPGGLDNPSV